MDIRKKQRVVVAALEDIKGRDILVYNTARMPSMFERVVIASGDSTRQVKALADNVQEKVSENGARGYGAEGEAAGLRVLVDLAAVELPTMHPTVRDFYNLEEASGDEPRLVRRAATRKPTAR